MVCDETWRDTIPSPQGPPLLEDDDYDDDYEVAPLSIPQVPTVEISDVHEEDRNEPSTDVPTRAM